MTIGLPYSQVREVLFATTLNPNDVRDPTSPDMAYFSRPSRLSVVHASDPHAAPKDAYSYTVLETLTIPLPNPKTTLNRKLPY